MSFYAPVNKALLRPPIEPEHDIGIAVVSPRRERHEQNGQSRHEHDVLAHPILLAGGGSPTLRRFAVPRRASCPGLRTLHTIS